jgi:NAD(P)-dependent dehydrogenase (short-subunit alcohol dehydrogenase family)
MRFDGTTALVIGTGPLTEKLAAGLAELGATVNVLPAPASREDAADAFAAHSSPDAVIVVAGVDGTLEDRPLAETNDDAWDREAEAPIRSAFYTVQAAYESFGGRGGAIVAALPSIALTGAAGLVPFASASEGIRLIVKSAARAWGGEGIRVNCVLLPIEEWGFTPADGHAVPNRYGPSLPGANSSTDVAGAVAMLISPLAAGVNGTTVGVDRGTVLAP